ncbi:MAG: hypothetical protein HUU35_12495, partial [Armatimonadetes bacterium]|nr:hypothetical protein [Armatimonadota bacterium]
TAPPGELVALDWASLGRNLPAGLTAVLTDLQNGRRLSMRTRSSYGYTSQGETRQFAIEVDRQSGERLRPTLSATPGRSRGATLTLNLNVPATVRLQVTSLTGRPVRSLLQQTAGSGLTAFNWDGRDNQNRPVPAGTYQVVVIAEADGGEVARATTQVTVR